MTREQIESAIVSASALGIPKSQVEASPDEPQEWHKVGPNGRLLWRYMGSERTNERPGSPRTIQYHGYVAARNLRRTGAQDGCYAMIASVQGALDGLLIKGAGGVDDQLRLIVGPDAFYREINKAWWYVLTVDTTPYKLTMPTEFQ